MKYVFPIDQYTHYRFPTHTNDLVIDRADATCSEVFVVVLEPGEAPPRHRHEDTEQIFYILSGLGLLEIGEPAENVPVRPGDVVRIPINAWHRIFCQGDQQLRYIAIDCFPAGRPDAEPTWDAHARVMCKNNGWDYATVRQSPSE